MRAFQWIAATFAVIWFLGWLFEHAADTFALLVNRFTHDGRNSVAESDAPIPSADDHEGRPGSPFAVDASNGRERRKLDSFVEVHRVPADVVPPPSRTIRRNQVH